MDLQQVILEQAALIDQLLEKIAELEAKIAQLEKNSGNSSKPPSPDIVKPRKDKDRRRKRNIGAQKGHPAHQRQPFAHDQIDQTVKITLDVCPQCKHQTLTVLETEPNIYQQVELVGRNFIVTEYICLHSHCEHGQRDFVAKRSKTLKVNRERLRKFVPC